MYMARMSDTLRRQRLEELEGIALARLREIIKEGSEKGALEASSLVLKRTMPEPKVNTAEIARQTAAGALAGAMAPLALIANKASARIIDNSEDAVFQPVLSDQQNTQQTDDETDKGPL